MTMLLALGVAGCGSNDVQQRREPAAVASPSVSPAASASPAASSSSPASGQDSSTSGVDSFRSPRTYREVALPTRVRIPSKGIDSRLGRVGLAADGTIDAPDLWQQAAWYDKGPRPGQEGPAVLVGHVDSKRGPAVFKRIGELRTGQQILVDRADGTTARFRVTRRDQFPKAGFPAADVYSPTLKPSLLLITCGGTFDSTTGHYRDNVVVTAVPD